jgi:XTP/dITP diphosphohydrolase
MKELVFASGNDNKVAEVEFKMGGSIKLRGLKSIGCTEDIPETGDTLEENAIMKARYVWENFGVSCFADDTGLEVESLQGAPGVLSARYAGPQRNTRDNMALLLSNLSDKSNRRARFRTVICLIDNGVEHLFEGIVNGTIIEQGRGEEGFGYDPIFLPDGSDKTFAEMSMVEKNDLSHRGRAIAALKQFLQQ